ncbi:Lauroyl/myristoyl acyltransferase [Nitrococcus mobilis Nb-231]|uniref:Lauroyl/myristoyl acyltransferase n=1 Tax=Nitrococcus mobilis Nb-231 TaxID=314278 RepID=A4BNY7_9GAMM|nr:Lauroyl/myristoyl acyltransferase [Nitrococcus mobilis Nb-231]
MGWILEALIVKSLVRLMQLMSPERATRFAEVIFRNLKPLLPFAGKIQRNLAVAFPEKDEREIERLTRGVCGNLGIAAAELVIAKRVLAEHAERFEFVIPNDLDLASYRDHPLVLITGHIGAWQYGGFLSAAFGQRMTTVYAPDVNPYLHGFLLKLRKALPCNFISRDGCMRGLAKELKQGNVVGLTSDTRLDSGDPLRFFGIPMPANTTAARLALRHNCGFFPVRAERLPGTKFRITLCPEIRPSDPDAPVADQARQMTQQVLDLFESWIREDPEQWMCFGRRWPRAVYANSSGMSSDTGRPRG